MKHDFSKKYENMIDESLPKEMLHSLEDRGGYLVETERPSTPAPYRRSFVHEKGDFVTLFCEDY